MVSLMKSMVGEILAIRQVLVFPPRESYRSLVSLESLKGMWSFAWSERVLSVDICFLVSFDITLPRLVSERLMFFSSLRC